MTQVTNRNLGDMPSIQMRQAAPSARDVRRLFDLGRIRFGWHGHKAYRMKHPGHGQFKWWAPYRAGIRAAEFGWGESRELHSLLKEARQ